MPKYTNPKDALVTIYGQKGAVIRLSKGDIKELETTPQVEKLVAKGNLVLVEENTPKVKKPADNKQSTNESNTAEQ